MKIFFLIIVLLAVFVLWLASRKPDTFQVKRAIQINAQSERIFALINDLRSFRTWSPWEEKDPSMSARHSGETVGVGSIFEWEGDKKVGKGRMEIIESTPNSIIKVKLDFLKPFEAHNTVEFQLEAEENTTNVSWVMYGPSPFMSKLMSVFVSMDKMVGPDFEYGLTRLKKAAEQPD